MRRTQMPLPPEELGVGEEPGPAGAGVVPPAVGSGAGPRLGPPLGEPPVPADAEPPGALPAPPGEPPAGPLPSLRLGDPPAEGLLVGGMTPGTPAMWMAAGGVAESYAAVTMTVAPAGTGPFGVTEMTVPVGLPVWPAQAIFGARPSERSRLITVASCCPSSDPDGTCTYPAPGEAVA